MHLDRGRLSKVVERLDRAVEERQIPGAVLSVGIGRETVLRHACGWAWDWGGQRRPATLETVWDLASLTKVVATLPAVLSLVDDGLVRLRDRVGLFVPAFDAKDKQGVTLWHLLTHTGGLISHRTYYEFCANAAEIWKAVEIEPLLNEPGTAVVYSDLGFMLLGRIVEIVSGQSLGRYVRERVFDPLGMRDTGFCPATERADLISRAAGTEVSPRTRQPKQGVVHDENAEALGGTSGHAGLFSTVADLEAYVKFWVSPDAHSPAVVSPAARRLAVQCHTEHLDGRRGLGWVARGDGYDHTGDLWPSSAVGHTGFTGTSLAFDPASGLWTILLTNRVHYGRDNNHIIRLRGLIHNLVAAALV
ncbi:MAG: beta-lactamase family protein [Alicyclobacillus sp.]|nr:beta-lactamase family protein [Alicyclobacillus sp.]